MGHLQKSFLYSLQHGNLKFKRPLLALILCLLGEMQQFEFWNWRLLKFGHYRSLIWKRWNPPGFWVLGVVLLFNIFSMKQTRKVSTNIFLEPAKSFFIAIHICQRQFLSNSFLKKSRVSKDNFLKFY